jgi:nucleotide-binding universal stress UspA family protein
MPEANRGTLLRLALIGLDGSEESDAARDLGLRWAARAEARVFGLGVIDEARLLEEEAAALPGAHHWRVAGIEAHRAEGRRRIREAIREFERCSSDFGVRCHSHQTEGGSAEQILAWSRRSDLVILGRRPREGHGSGTLEAVLRECPRPVVAVPANAEGGEAVIVAYDGSAQASRAIYAFVASGLGLGRPVHVVAVEPSEVAASSLAATAADYLAAHDLEAHPCPVATEQAPAAALLDRSHRLGAGLLVMGAFGQSAVREFFLGSVTRTLLGESRAPIFCFH